MKIYFGGAIILLIAVFFSSCQKEIDWGLTNGITKDSTYISQLIVLDTTFSSGADTSLKYLFTYDGNKRISKMLLFEYDLGVSGPAALVYGSEMYYTYSASDSVPKTIIGKYFDYQTPAANYNDTISYEYQNGVVSKDSAGVPASNYITLYNKLTASRYQLIIKSSGPFGTSSDTSYANVVRQNNNLVSEIDSVWLAAISGWDITQHQFTYDNNPNPLRRAMIPYPAETFPTPDNVNDFFEGFANYSVNNILTWQDGTSPHSTQYTYRTNGLPDKAFYHDGIDIYKVIFQYTSL